MKLIDTKWAIITGTSCSGKTKVIERLNFLGFKTFPEASRIILDNEESKGNSVEKVILNKKDFEEKIITFKVLMEEKADIANLSFFDRSLIDSEAFIRLYDVKNVSIVKKMKYKYKYVFLLDSLTLKTESKRFENDDQRLELRTHLINAYHNYGYELIKIGIDSIENRVNTILKYMSNGL
jgi:predicted ATPase